MFYRWSAVMLLAIGGAVGWHPPARFISTPRRCSKPMLTSSSSTSDSRGGGTTEETSMVVMEDGIQIKMSSTPSRPEIGKKERNSRLRELNGAIANCFIKASDLPPGDLDKALELFAAARADGLVTSTSVHEQVLNLVALHRPAECPGLFNALEAELFAPWETGPVSETHVLGEPAYYALLSSLLALGRWEEALAVVEGPVKTRAMGSGPTEGQGEGGVHLRSRLFLPLVDVLCARSDTGFEANGSEMGPGQHPEPGAQPAAATTELPAVARDESCKAALRLWQQMLDGGVEVLPHVHAQLIATLASRARASRDDEAEVASETSSWVFSALQEIMQEMVRDTTVFEQSTLEVLHTAWRLLPLSPQSASLDAEGKARTSTAAQVEEPIELNLRGNLRSGWTSVDSSGVCAVTGRQLAKRGLSDKEAAQVRSVLAIKLPQAFVPSFEAFDQFLAKATATRGQPFTICVDGANVAYHKQNFNGGKFNFKQLEVLVDHLIASGEDPLVVLPRKYTKDMIPNHAKRSARAPVRFEVVAPLERAFLERLRSEGRLWITPQGSNDDWYWIYASVLDGEHDFVSSSLATAKVSAPLTGRYDRRKEWKPKAAAQYKERRDAADGLDTEDLLEDINNRDEAAIAAEAASKAEAAAEFKVLLKAAEDGDAAAQTAVGKRYKKGLGLERDDVNSARAVMWLRKGAKQGNSTAMRSLAGLYKNGQGVNKDYSKAGMWFGRAQKREEQESREALAGTGADGDWTLDPNGNDDSIPVNEVQSVQSGEWEDEDDREESELDEEVGMEKEEGSGNVGGHRFLPVVTNDQMRDHWFDLLPVVAFERWKQIAMRRFDIKHVLPVEASTVPFDSLSDYGEFEGKDQDVPLVPIVRVDSEPLFSPIAQTTLDEAPYLGKNQSVQGWHLPTANKTETWLFLDLVLPE